MTLVEQVETGEVEFTGEECFFKFGGVRIAKRGQIGVNKRGKIKMGWLPLVEGYRVRDTHNGSRFVVDVPGGAGQ
jgi:hypothetical protein